LDKKVNNLNGYKSSLIFLNNKSIIATGTSGIDLSKDKGHTWEKVSNESFHVVEKHPKRNAVFLAGSGGRIGYLNFE
jgi:hypothetical protein